MIFAKAIGYLRDNTPAFLAGVVVLSLLAASCGKNIDNSVVQLQKDRKIIAAWLDEHCLTPEGDIIPLAQAPNAAFSANPANALPEGYIPLGDTATAVGNMYIIHLAQGKGDRGTAIGRVFIHFQGHYLNDMQLFDAVWTDQPLYPLWTSGAIQGIRLGLTAMRSGILDPDQPTGYASPGQAWLVLPSTMAFGEDGRTDPLVPPNTCVAYRVILYGVEP